MQYRLVAIHTYNQLQNQPKTFAQFLVWDSFCHEAISRFEALDDSAQEFLPQVRQLCRHYLHKGVLVYQPNQRWLLCEVSDAHCDFVQDSNNNRDLQMLPPAADESEVRGYIFRFLSQLSILARELGLGEIATVLSIMCCVFGSSRVFGRTQCLTSLVCGSRPASLACLWIAKPKCHCCLGGRYHGCGVQTHVGLPSSRAIELPVTGV